MTAFPDVPQPTKFEGSFSTVPAPATTLAGQPQNSEQSTLQTTDPLSVPESEQQPPPPKETLPFRWHSLSGRSPRPPSPLPSQLELPFTASFRFFSLPAELRVRIYDLILPSYETLTRVRPPRPKKRSPPNPSNPLPRLAIFLANKRFHDETSHRLYSKLTFRLFPLQDDHPIPTLIDIAPRHRNHITSLELLLGSSWTGPPKSWRVTKSLGLTDLHSLRTLRVFVQFDPSHPFFKNFRVSHDFYTDFCGVLLRKVLFGMPQTLACVQFDGNPGIRLDGPLMTRLVEEVRRTKRVRVAWGAERGWAETWFDQLKIS
ncbi:MAG: hypothetical protein Q9227_000384 [Pyrenula ochraceoflavens]